MSNIVHKSVFCAAIFLTTAILGGCASVTPEQQFSLDYGKCDRFGFPRKTVQFAECMQKIDLNRSANQRANNIRSELWWSDRSFYGARPFYRRGLYKYEYDMFYRY